MKRLALIIALLAAPHIAWGQCAWDTQHQKLWDSGQKYALKLRKCEAKALSLQEKLDARESAGQRVKVVRPEVGVWKFLAIGSSFFILGYVTHAAIH